MKILVIVDYNDADYIEHTYRDITEETFQKFMPMIEAIKNFIPYPYGLNDLSWHNFPTGDNIRKDLYEKDPYEIYSQFPKEYVKEFIETFLVCNFGEYGFHSIIEIMNIVTDEIYYKRPEWQELWEKSINDPSVKMFLIDKEQSAQKWADLCGCSIKEACSKPFSEMSPEALDAYNEYESTWKKYRPDLL